MVVIHAMCSNVFMTSRSQVGSLSIADAFYGHLCGHSTQFGRVLLVSLVLYLKDLEVSLSLSDNNCLFRYPCREMICQRVRP